MSSDTSLPRKPKVLIVDDDKAIVDIVVYHLNHVGFDASGNDKSEEAMASIESFNPDMLVLDIMMPELNGFELLDTIRRSPDYCELPVLMLSAVSDKRGIMMAAKLKVSGYIVKPFTPKALIDKLSEIIEEHKLPEPILDETEEEVAASFDEQEISVLEDLSKVKSLPKVPFLVKEFPVMLRNQDMEVTRLAQRIESSTTISTQLLKIINGPHYEPGKFIDSVDLAIVKMGMKEVSDIAMFVSMMQTFHFPESGGFTPSTLWGHSFAVALLARQLAESIGHPRPYDVFEAGLFHDYGKYIMNLLCPKHMAQAVQASQEDRINFEESQTKHLQKHHRQLADSLSKRMKLPPLVHLAMKYHDAWKYPLVEDAAEKRALGCIHVADRMIRAAGLGHDGTVLLRNVSSLLWEDLKVNNSKTVERVFEKVLGEWSRFTQEADLIHAIDFDDRSFLYPDAEDERPCVVIVDERQRPLNFPAYLFATSPWRPVFKLRTANLVQFVMDHPEKIEGIVICGLDPDQCKAFHFNLRELPLKNIKELPVFYVREENGGDEGGSELDSVLQEQFKLHVVQEPFTRTEFFEKFKIYREAFLEKREL